MDVRRLREIDLEIGLEVDMNHIIMERSGGQAGSNRIADDCNDASEEE